MHDLKSCVLAAAILLGIAPAFAQLGNGGTTYSGLGNSKDPAGDLMTAFVALTQANLAADAELFAAIGQAGEADKASAAASTLATDATVGVLETVVGAQSETGAALQRALDGKTAALDETSKRRFGEAMLALATSLKRYAALSKDLPDLKQSLRNGTGKARSALYAAKTIPGSFADTRRTMKSAAAFARANQIPVAAEVDEANAMP